MSPAKYSGEHEFGMHIPAAKGILNQSIKNVFHNVVRIYFLFLPKVFYTTNLEFGTICKDES